MIRDRILWEYLEELPEQEAAWNEWYQRLSEWPCFNTFYNHYLKIEYSRATRLKCIMPCDHGCARRVVEHSHNDVAAVCPHGKATSVQLKFKDILIYSLRRDAFHRALCATLQIKYSGYRWPEYGNAWYLGDYCDDASKVHRPVYLTYRAATLPETINLLCRLHQEPFLLMAPTGHGLTPEAQQLLDKNSSVLFSMEAQLTLLSDGSFKAVRSISECTRCSQINHGVTLKPTNNY